jgi:hypothetical protein
MSGRVKKELGALSQPYQAHWVTSVPTHKPLKRGQIKQS